MPRQSPSLRDPRGLPLQCSHCRASNWHWSSNELTCGGCSASFAVRDGQIDFLGVGADGGVVERLDRVKNLFKRYHRLYRFLQWLIGPLCFDGTERRFIGERVRGREGLFLNLGSGGILLDPALVNVDAATHSNVQLVCDITSLPIADGSVDGIINISVLEHVADPHAVVAEIHRVLKPGGWVYTDVPFVVGYHASPGDYNRWTDEGVRRLHADFEFERLVNNGGPTSALLWIFQEWLAIVLSFGSRRLHTWIYLLVMVFTFPVKFLDLLFKHLPTARLISSCFIYIGRKPLEKPRT